MANLNKIILEVTKKYFSGFDNDAWIFKLVSDLWIQ